MKPKFLILLALPFLLNSCILNRSSTGEPFSATALNRLEAGKSTAREVVASLGAPTNIVRLNQGSAYVYEHVRAKSAGLFLGVVLLGNTDQRADRIWFFFDSKDRLTHMGSTISAERTEYSLPCEDLYDELPDNGPRGGRSN